ncbi:hypothetical protein [Bacteroides sp.]|uniref:hypothetical protein n=1 Tax=Bacteroides sp. TaxID=29523 RepID=UPI00261F62AE|nr:hypothetical protein [Bacteroides sp.]MDD3039022.1 hypothetical protein [Bacteroides sp.]
MVKNANNQFTKRPNKNNFYNIPLVLDHSRDMLDKVGAVYDVAYGTAKGVNDSDISSCIAQVIFWNETSRQQEMVKILRKDPENIYFSVSVNGRFIESKKTGAVAKMIDMNLKHIAVVQEPADKNARIIFSDGFDINSIFNANTDIDLNTENKIQLSMENSTVSQTTSDVVDQSITAGTTTVGTGWTHTDNTSGVPPFKFSYNITDEETVKRLTRENAELRADYETLLKNHEAVKFALEELDKKVPIISEILALRPEMDKSFMYSLSTDQLTAVKSMIVDYSEKIETATRKTPVRGMFADTSSVKQETSVKEDFQMTPDELALKYYGKYEE